MKQTTRLLGHISDAYGRVTLHFVSEISDAGGRVIAESGRYSQLFEPGDAAADVLGKSADHMAQKFGAAPDAAALKSALNLLALVLPPA